MLIAVYFVSLVVGIIVLILWANHRSMTVDYSLDQEKPWGYGTFDDFLREYHKREWRSSRYFPLSQFSYRGSNLDDPLREDGYIHAGIISFGGNGMVLYPWSWLRFTFWVWAQGSVARMYKNNLWKSN